MTNRILLEPYLDFEEASAAALALLQGQLGMGLWIISRTTEEDYVILDVSNREHAYPIKKGDVFRWSDTFCSRMFAGDGPNIAPKVEDVDAYHERSIALNLPIAAYVGMPLQGTDGEFFGTLCAIDPVPQADTLEMGGPMLEVIGRFLSTMLERDLRIARHARRAEQASDSSLHDELTGVWNQRAWDQFIASEEVRCQRYGTPACVLVVDLEGVKTINSSQGYAAGDALMRKAGRALADAIREPNTVARIAGDKFWALLVESAEQKGRQLEQRVREVLKREKIKAAIGFARRDPRGSIGQALAHAEIGVQLDKSRRGR